MARAPLQRTEAELAAWAAMNRFQPHGRVQMWADGALVHVVAEGPFNVEGIDAFSNAMLALYRQLPPGQAFVNITEVRKTLLGTPDAWERLGEHLLRTNASGLPLRGTAWVVDAEVEGRSLLLPRAQALFVNAGRRVEVFETLATAEAWARRLLSA